MTPPRRFSASHGVCPKSKAHVPMGFSWRLQNAFGIWPPPSRGTSGAKRRRAHRPPAPERDRASEKRHDRVSNDVTSRHLVWRHESNHTHTLAPCGLAKGNHELAFLASSARSCTPALVLLQPLQPGIVHRGLHRPRELLSRVRLEQPQPILTESSDMTCEHAPCSSCDLVSVPHVIPFG